MQLKAHRSCFPEEGGLFADILTGHDDLARSCPGFN